MNLLLISFAIILVLIILLVSVVVKSSNVLDIIPGFWTASEKFCADIGVDEMIVYFGNAKGNKYPCYVMIVDGNDVYENINTTAKISSGILGSSDKTKATHKFNVEFADKPRALPQNIKMKINTNDGSCILIDNEDVVYAILYRDNKLSADIAVEQEQDISADEESTDAVLVDDVE